MISCLFLYALRFTSIARRLGSIYERMNGFGHLARANCIFLCLAGQKRVGQLRKQNSCIISKEDRWSYH